MADNVFRVTVTAVLYGQQCQNVIHLSGPSSDPGQMSVLATEIRDVWVEKVRGVITQDVKFVNINVRLLGSQFAPFDKTINVNGAGSASNQQIPFACYVIRLRSALIGRKGHGRVYIPGVLNGVTDFGLLNQSTLNFWSPRLADIMAAFGPGGTSTFRLGVGPKVNTTANFKEVINLQMAPTLGSQRRRNIGIGA